MASIVPSERFRRELDEALAGVDRDDDPVEMIARLGARLILQVALESEVEGFLGRARYERAAEGVGYRNGFGPRTVKATSGPLELERVGCQKLRSHLQIRPISRPDPIFGTRGAHLFDLPANRLDSARG